MVWNRKAETLAGRKSRYWEPEGSIVIADCCGEKREDRIISTTGNICFAPIVGLRGRQQRKEEASPLQRNSSQRCSNLISGLAYLSLHLARVHGKSIQGCNKVEHGTGTQ
jgi:hypothetical protein